MVHPMQVNNHNNHNNDRFDGIKCVPFNGHPFQLGRAAGQFTILNSLQTTSKTATASGLHPSRDFIIVRFIIEINDNELVWGVCDLSVSECMNSEAFKLQTHLP